jgi:hypothetical protein
MKVKIAGKAPRFAKFAEDTVGNARSKNTRSILIGWGVFYDP